MSDLRITLDTLAAILATESLVKPAARQAGRWLLARADRWAPWIPDWLHGGRND